MFKAALYPHQNIKLFFSHIWNNSGAGIVKRLNIFAEII